MDTTTNEEKEISLSELFSEFWEKLWIILIATVIGASIAFSFSKFFMPLKYKSYVSMYVKNSDNDTSKAVNWNDINASQSLVKTYIVVLQDDNVMNKVGEELVKTYDKSELAECFTLENKNGTTVISPSSLRKCLTMEAVNETEVLKITAETKIAKISAAVCNTLADIAPDFLIRFVGAGSVEVIGDAEIFNTPSSPNVRKNTLIGALAGFVLSTASVVVLHLLDNTIKNAEDLEKNTQKPVLAEIYSMGTRKNSKNRLTINKKISDRDVPFYVIESYNSLRTNLIFSLASSEKKIVAMTSASPSEGKSTTAANLSIALSQEYKKVLLIDADMRKPVQHKTFKIRNLLGLSNVLGGINTFDECVRSDVLPNLDLLSAGISPPNPSELLGSQKTSDLLEELSKIYDYIIIDAPPVNVVTDVLSLGDSISGILLIAKHESTTYPILNKTIKNIEKTSIPILGLVLNDIKAKNTGYYKKAYYNNYYYGSSDKNKKKNK